MVFLVWRYTDWFGLLWVLDFSLLGLLRYAGFEFVAFVLDVWDLFRMLKCYFTYLVLLQFGFGVLGWLRVFAFGVLYGLLLF